MSQPASDTGLWSRLRAAGCVFRLPRRAATPAGSGTPPGRRDTAAYALFLLLACLPVWPAVFGGEVLLPAQYVRAFSPWRAEYAPPEPMPPWNALLADSILQYLPWRQFTHESLRAGYLPLWNPHQFCGTPFLANYQSAVFYPPNLLFWILPPARAFGYSALLHLFLAGAFLFLYLRGRGLGLAAATLGGVAFELSGFLMAWLELPTAVNVAVWLPLVLHLYERAREGSGARRGLPVLFPLAMILLAGHPQFAFYSLFAFACYSLAHLPNGTGPRERAAAWAWCAGLPLALAGLVAAPQILPMLELSRLSHRAGGSFLRPGAGAYLLQAQPAWAAIVLLLPDFFGNPSRGDAWGPANYAEFVGYTGVLPLLLAIAAVAGAALPRRRAQVLAALPPGAGRHIAFFAALAALAVATSFRNPLGQAFYSVMPGFGQFGSPGRMLFLFSVSVAVLGAFGTHLLCWSNGVREYWSGDAAGARPLPHNGAPPHSPTPPLPPPPTPGLL